MLLVLTGSSGAGKTTLRQLSAVLLRLRQLSRSEPLLRCGCGFRAAALHHPVLHQPRS